MRGLFPGAAEVVRIARDGLAEVPEPQAVDDGACGERVVLVGDPVREHRASAFDAFRKLNGAKN